MKMPQQSSPSFIFKFNLKMVYATRYACEVQDYGKAQNDSINRPTVNQFDWVNLYLDNNINEQVTLLNRTI